MAIYQTSDDRQAQRCLDAQEMENPIHEYFGDVVVKGYVQSVEFKDDKWFIMIVSENSPS